MSRTNSDRSFIKLETRKHVVTWKYKFDLGNITVRGFLVAITFGDPWIGSN